MLWLATGLAQWESGAEVKHERLSELWLRLQLQPVLLLRSLTRQRRRQACPGGFAADCAQSGL